MLVTVMNMETQERLYYTCAPINNAGLYAAKCIVNVIK